MMKVELPNLLSVEFSSNQGSRPCFEDPSVVDKHERRWRALFCQMGTALEEEEKHLESLSIQVQNMRALCEKGLKYVTADGLPVFGSSEDPRLRKPDKLELASLIRAAAASIYSTSNLTMTRENAT